MDSRIMRGTGYGVTALVCLLGCLYYYFFFFNRALVEVDVAVEQKTRFKIYWAAGDRNFSERRSAVVALTPGQTQYTFYLTDLGRVERLRVDPFDYAGQGTLRRLALSQTGFEPLVADLGTLEPLHDIAARDVTPEGLVIRSTGIDPNLLFVPDISPSPYNRLLELGRYAAICTMLLLVIAGTAPLRTDFGFVPLLLAMVFALILVMAVVSKRGTHPDEHVHLAATAYYEQHWLPPEIDDPAIEKTYSVYGISRLNNGEIYYLLAGKFSKLLEALRIDPLLAQRGFNVLLFGLITLYALRSVEARLVALPFLLTPQLWYLFSYCVSDAFGLFLCFLVGCELVRERSLLNRVLDSQRRLPAVALGMVALLLGLLFLLKINYYPFIVLVYGVLFWRWLRSPGTRGALAGRVVILTVLALVLAGVRIGADYQVNGPERERKLAAMQELTADHWHKPSTELHKKHVSMYMKDRGTTLKAMIIKHKWFGHSFETGFGKYGYFTISASKTYYQLMKWAIIAFLVYDCGAVALKGDTEGRLLALLVAGLALGLIGASLHRSWTIDFQAQGRYLFPLLPMIGVVLARNRSAIDHGLFILITMHPFLLSLYSFVFIALVAIPRS